MDDIVTIPYQIFCLLQLSSVVKEETASSFQIYESCLGCVFVKDFIVSRYDGLPLP